MATYRFPRRRIGRLSVLGRPDKDVLARPRVLVLGRLGGGLTGFPGRLGWRVFQLFGGRGVRFCHPLPVAFVRRLGNFLPAILQLGFLSGNRPQPRCFVVDNSRDLFLIDRRGRTGRAHDEQRRQQRRRDDRPMSEKTGHPSSLLGHEGPPVNFFL
jgi:hypothetical protein